MTTPQLAAVRFEFVPPEEATVECCVHGGHPLPVYEAFVVWRPRECGRETSLEVNATSYPCRGPETSVLSESAWMQDLLGAAEPLIEALRAQVADAPTAEEGR